MKIGALPEKSFPTPVGTPAPTQQSDRELLDVYGAKEVLETLDNYYWQNGEDSKREVEDNLEELLQGVCKRLTRELSDAGGGKRNSVFEGSHQRRKGPFERSHRTAVPWTARRRYYWKWTNTKRGCLNRGCGHCITCLMLTVFRVVMQPIAGTFCDRCGEISALGIGYPYPVTRQGCHRLLSCDCFA
eukprot:5315748-Amphidinium_carterae.1